MRRAWSIATWALVLGTACSSHHAAAPVFGANEDVQQLSGEWSGEYSTGSSGRNGSIVFTLTPGRDSAYGDVVMVPRGEGQGSRTPRGTAPPDPQARGPQTLTISFVRVANGVVSWKLKPYDDPDCNCTLSTTFTGTINGDTIEGTFTTNGPAQGGVAETGRWKVSRKKG